LKSLLQFGSPEEFEAVMELSKKILPEKDYVNFKVSYALKNNAVDRAKFDSMNEDEKSLWLDYYFSISDHDYYRQQRLLSLSAGLLSPADRVNSAVNTGQYNLAQELAFKNLEYNQQNSNLYLQTTKLKTSQADKFYLDTYYLQRGGLHQSAMEMDVELYASKGFTLSLTLGSKNNQVGDDSILNSIPDQSSKIGISIARQFDDSQLQVSAGLYDSMDTYLYVDMQWSQKLTNRWDYQLAFNYGDQASETVYLLLGGKKIILVLRLITG